MIVFSQGKFCAYMILGRTIYFKARKCSIVLRALVAHADVGISLSLRFTEEFQNNNCILFFSDSDCLEWDS